MSAPLLGQKIHNERQSFTFGGPTFLPIYIPGPYGSRINRIALTTEQSSSMPNITIFKGDCLTDNSMQYPGCSLLRMGQALHPVLAVGSTSSITRTNGSFIQDGWAIGQAIGVVNDDLNVLNQSAGLVHASTAVTATTLTLAAATLNSSSGTLGPATKLFRLTRMWLKAIVASSGNATGTTPQLMLDNSIDPTILLQPDDFLELQGGDQLVSREWLFALVSAAPATATQAYIQVDGQDY